MSLLRRLVLLPLGAALLAPVAHAQTAVGDDEVKAGFSQNVEVDFVSDYVFRGISNSNENYALQPSYTANWTQHNGNTLSLGVWASTLDPESQVEHEVDLWGTYAFSTSFADFSASYTWYSYPGSPEDSDLSFGEFQLTAGKDLGSVYLNGEYDFSPDYFGGTGDAHYVSLALNTNDGVMPGGLVLSGHVGHQWFDDNAAFGAPDYTDGGLRLERTWNWLTAGLEASTTDIDDADCFGGADICGSRVFATLGIATP